MFIRRLATGCLASLLIPMSLSATAQTIADTGNTVIGSVTQLNGDASLLVHVTQTCSAAWCPTEGKDIQVTLSSIETLERDQPFGDVARNTLEQLLSGRDVYITPAQTPSGITVSSITGDVFTDTSWLNRDLVANGLAWAQKQAMDDEGVFAQVQASAINFGKGVWSGHTLPVPPWEWRDGVRSINVEQLGEAADGWLRHLNGVVIDTWESHGEATALQLRRNIPVIDQALDELAP